MDAPTISLNAPITLASAQTLAGTGTTVNVASSGLIQNGVDVALDGGATVNVAAGTYNENVVIDKSGLTLQSNDGSASTKIVGQGSSAPGAVYTTNGASDNFTLGGIGHGFTIIGIDNASAGIESAAVYIRGTNAGSSIVGNAITANGDEGLLTDYNASVTNLVVDHNVFDGKTFSGSTAGGSGFGSQWTTANVPRQLVVISGGSAVTNTQNITFTNNQVTGTAGALNSSGQEQGNTLVTIDAVGATITGNTFDGTTTRYADALRARGSSTTISGNTFDGANMGMGTNMLDLKDGALSGTFADVVANNTFDNGSAWFDHTVGGYNYVYRGIENAVSYAAAGDTVNVGAGTYQEQVVIDKNLTLDGAGAGSTIISSPDTLSHSFAAGSSTYKAVVSIENGANATISNLTVDGRGQGSSNHKFLGIGIHNASADVENVDITGIRDGGPTGTLDGIQAGVGIEAYNEDGTARTVTLKNSMIEDFQKNATAFVGGNLTVDIEGNTITGAGSTGVTAQNGIELWGVSGVGDGLITGTISGNTITDVSYSPVSNWSSTDILIIGADNLQITGNTVTGKLSTDYSNGIYLSGVTSSTVSGNTLSNLGWALDADTSFGSTSGLTITGNNFSNNYEAVYLDTSIGAPTLTGNTFTSNTYQMEGTAAEVTSALANNSFDATAVDTNVGTAIYGDLQTAIGDASAGDNLDVAGTFTTNGQVDISKNLTITGDAAARATITPGSDYIGDHEANSWFLVDPGVDFGLSNVKLDGTGHAVYQAIRSEGNLTVDNVDFSNIMGSASGSPYRGVAIESFGGTVAGGAGSDTNGSGGSAASLTVTNSTFENIGREGILVKGTGSTATITGNTYTGKGVGDWLDYGIEIGAGGSATITGNTITDAVGVAASDGSTSAAIMVTTYYGSGSSATIQNNVLNNNWAAVDVGYDSADTSVVHAQNNDLSGNTHGVELKLSLAMADFSGNWWGSTNDATIAAYQTGASASSVDFSPYLMTGTDTDGSTTGFQGDFSNIAVTLLGAGSSSTRIQEGMAAVDAGGTVNVMAGTYTLPGQLNINKSLSLVGAGEGSTILNSNSAGYGISVSADNVTLSSFTYNADPSGSYSIKVSPGGAPSSRLLTFAIDHVTINDSHKTGLDLNGVNGATIDHVNVNNTTNGNGITLTNSANVTITNSTTTGNAWGGLALYQDNSYYDQQETNIIVEANNTFNEVNPVYLQDSSDGTTAHGGPNGLDYGTLNIAGYSYAVRNANGPTQNDGQQFTWLQNDQQKAINFAMGSFGMINTDQSTVQGWDGSALTNTFTVGTSSGGNAMSIGAAVGAASASDTIDVLAGTYGGFHVSSSGPADLTIQTNAGAVIDASAVPTTPITRIVDLQGDGTTFSGFTITGNGNDVRHRDRRSGRDGERQYH